MKKIVGSLVLMGCLTTGCPTAPDSSEPVAEASGRNTNNENPSVRTDGPVFDFQNEIWEQMFSTNYKSGESQWLVDDLPTSPGKVTGVNELNESYETELTQVGEEMNAYNILGLTNEAYQFMVDWNVRAVTIDGLFNFADGSSQIYHAMGLSLVDPDSGGKVTIIFPFSDATTDEIQSRVLPPPTGSTPSGFFTNHGNYETWWECPELPENLCDNTTGDFFLDQSCVDEEYDRACNEYKEKARHAYDYPASQTGGGSADKGGYIQALDAANVARTNALKECEEEGLVNVTSGLLTLASIFSTTPWGWLCAAASIAVFAVSSESYEECRQKAMLSSQNEADAAFEKFKSDIDAITDFFMNDFKLCCTKIEGCDLQVPTPSTAFCGGDCEEPGAICQGPFSSTTGEDACRCISPTDGGTPLE